MNRRAFLKTGSATLIMGAGLAGFSSSCSALGKIYSIPQVSSDGFDVKGNNLYVYLNKVMKQIQTYGAVKFSYIDPDTLKRIKLILIMTQEHYFFAFEDRCTHCGKELEFNNKTDTLNCTGIGYSKFQINGKVLKGPAKERLRMFICSYDENTVVIKLQA